MQTVAEMIPDYKKNLDALRARRRELIAERELEPRFERRHALTVRMPARWHHRQHDGGAA